MWTPTAPPKDSWPGSVWPVPVCLSTSSSGSLGLILGQMDSQPQKLIFRGVTSPFPAWQGKYICNKKKIFKSIFWENLHEGRPLNVFHYWHKLTLTQGWDRSWQGSWVFHIIFFLAREAMWLFKLLKIFQIQNQPLSCAFLPLMADSVTLSSLLLLLHKQGPKGSPGRLQLPNLKGLPLLLDVREFSRTHSCRQKFLFFLP